MASRKYLQCRIQLTMSFNHAVEAVKRLNKQRACGHSDWQIPSVENLRILFKHQHEGALICSFSKAVCTDFAAHASWYWSSDVVRNEPNYKNYMHSVRFQDSRVGADDKTSHKLSCRSVHLVPVK